MKNCRCCLAVSCKVYARGEDSRVDKSGLSTAKPCCVKTGMTFKCYCLGIVHLRATISLGDFSCFVRHRTFKGTSRIA
jgi:hypothetical protein